MLRTQTRSERRSAGFSGSGASRTSTRAARAASIVGCTPRRTRMFAAVSSVARVVAVERRDAPLHHAFLPEVREVARDQRDQERRARDRAVDPRDLRGLDPQLLGDHRAWGRPVAPAGRGSPTPARTRRGGPIRTASAARRRAQGRGTRCPPGAATLRVCVGSARRVRRFGAVRRRVGGRIGGGHSSNLTGDVPVRLLGGFVQRAGPAPPGRMSTGAR